MKINKNITLLLFILLTLSLSTCGGDHKEYHHDGSLKSIGNFLPNGKKDGQWQTFYRNGSPMSKGMYSKGEKEGRWTYWNKDGEIVARKNFNNGVEDSGSTKEAAPKVTKKHSSQPEPKHTPKAEPKAEHTTEHKAAAEPEKTTTHEVKRTEPYVENSSGFAATMEEWKVMKNRKKAMPEIEAAVEIAVEELPEPVVEEAPEPVQVSAPVVEQKVEISEPVQTAPVQEVVAQPVAEIAAPAERVVEPVKEEVPVQKKKAVKSGGKFWKN